MSSNKWDQKGSWWLNYIIILQKIQISVAKWSPTTTRSKHYIQTKPMYQITIFPKAGIYMLRWKGKHGHQIMYDANTWRIYRMENPRHGKYILEPCQMQIIATIK